MVLALVVYKIILNIFKKLCSEINRKVLNSCQIWFVEVESMHV